MEPPASPSIRRTRPVRWVALAMTAAVLLAACGQGRTSVDGGLLASEPVAAAVEARGAVMSATTAEGAAAFRPVVPCRLVDTRDTDAPVGPGSSITVHVLDRCGAGSTATAALVTLTAVEPAAAGYLTAYAAGSARPATSTLNVSPSDIRANTAVVPVGPGGIAVYAQPRTHVVVDLLGVWEPAAGPAAAGGSWRRAPIASSTRASASAPGRTSLLAGSCG